MTTVPEFASDADWSGQYRADGLPAGSTSADLAATADGSGTVVAVAAGEILAQDMRLIEDTSTDLDVAAVGVAPTASQNRADLIVARLTRGADYTMTLAVSPGTPATAGSEAPPALVRDASTYEVPIAKVTRRGTNAITQDDIADFRQFRGYHVGIVEASGSYSNNTLNDEWVNVPLTIAEQLDPGFTQYGRGLRCSIGGYHTIHAFASWSVPSGGAAGLRVKVIDEEVTGATNPTGGESSSEVFASAVVNAARDSLSLCLDIPQGYGIYLQAYATDVPVSSSGKPIRLAVEKAYP